MAAAVNVLQRQFNARAANQEWGMDVTEFNVAGQKLNLSPVMALNNSKLIAFEAVSRPAFELVSTMLERALGKLKSKGLSPVQYRIQPLVA